MHESYDICVIGGGVVGTAIAREATKYCLKVLLLERCGDVAEGISKANSGVLHAGFNVKSGSLKARFNVEGLSFFPELAYQLDVPYRLCKKLVIAKDDSELPYLEKLLEQGKKNGSPGLSIIGEAEIRRLEPLISGRYALYSQRTAIISPYELTIAYAESAQANGADIRLLADVCAIERDEAEDCFIIRTADESIFRSRMVVNSAGNHSDKVASFPAEQKHRLHPCKGEYYVLDTDASRFLKMAVYPVPPADGSGLGVHLTPTINGNILIGPSADYLDDPDDLSTTKPVMELLKKEAFELLPALRSANFIKSYSGIRPKLFNSETGKTFEDFVIEQHPAFSRYLNLIGIESPGLTASPAIAKYVVEQFVSRYFPLIENERFNPIRKSPIRRTKFLTPDAIRKLIDENPTYGEVICRCEQVSKAEVLLALRNPLGAKTLNAIKKRTHAMMGRCQSGFCLPKIAGLLMDELGMEPDAIYRDEPDSRVFLGRSR